METKSIFKSRTMWLNAIAGIVAITTYINPEMLTAFGISPEKQHSVLTIVGAVTALANIVLRSFTNTAVSVNPTKPSENAA